MLLGRGVRVSSWHATAVLFSNPPKTNAIRSSAHTKKDINTFKSRRVALTLAGSLVHKQQNRAAGADIKHQGRASTTRMMRYKVYQRLLLVQLMLVGAMTAAARQLEGEAGAATENQLSQRHSQAETNLDRPQKGSNYNAVLSNSSCHGFLIGIGTQKGTQGWCRA